MTLTDYFLISIPKVFDDLQTDTGLIGRNNVWYIDKERDRYSRKIRNGKVVALPMGYSDGNYSPIDPGVPNHRIYLGHDAIQASVNMGRNPKAYYPGSKEQIDFKSLADIGALVDVQIGEMVYFHPNVTEPDNVHQELEGETIYRCLPDVLICVGTRMQAGWVLVEPHAAESVVDGFIVSVEPVSKMLEGTVAHIRDREHLKAGDHVYFQLDSNWEYEVDGNVYFAMRDENVWMKRVKTCH